MTHRVSNHTATLDCQIFDYFVEARINPPGKQQKASATEAIENAFQQVTLGLTALASRLRSVHELRFFLLPIVVTTAELMVADFSLKDVPIHQGTIESAKLKLMPKQWLATNYRVNDSICQQSRITTNRSADLGSDLLARQVRTVFVVQAAHVQSFLTWLESYLVGLKL